MIILQFLRPNQKIPSQKHSPFCTILWVTALFIIARLLFITFSGLDLSPDEAQYWSWLQHPALSYVTKPPLTTWLIGLGTTLFGDTLLGVRFFAVICHAIASVFAYLIARECYAHTPRATQAGWWAFTAFQVTPLLAIGGILMVSDVPTLAAWLGALYLLIKLNWRAENWRIWLLIGALVGLAGLAKYTAVFFYPLLAIYLLWQHPRYFLKFQPYVAGFISLAIQAPVLWWNYQHDWLGIKHVLAQSGGHSAAYNVQEGLAEFLISQAATLGLVAFVFMLVFWLTPWRQTQKGKLLWCFAAPLFAFFIWKATGAKVQANWPILATSVSLLAVAGWVGASRGRTLKVIFGFGLVLSATLSFFLHNTFLLRDLGVSLPMKNDPSKDLRGWKEIGNGVAKILATIPPTENPIILTTRYRMTGEMAFTIPNSPPVLYVNPGIHRLNQYDLWPWPPLKNRTALYVNQNGGLPAVIRTAYKTCTPQPLIVARKQGLILRRGEVFICRGYLGLTRIKVDKH